MDALAYVSDALVGGLGTVPGLSLDPPANPAGTLGAEQETDHDGRVMAYAKLDFPEHDFFIRKLEIVIGRRPPNATAAAAAAQRAQAEQQVDLVPEPEPV
ncbi:MAG: hypothetical protein INR71_13770, partial [Terriglobus roseus]|nr:hypothetical protein [Terriglobus roseus]